MEWQFIHTGYYRAESPYSDEFFVVRTRPKNDGWMAIAEDDNIVMGTGLSLSKAKEICETAAVHRFELPDDPL